jgi:hypothetical protein
MHQIENDSAMSKYYRSFQANEDESDMQSIKYFQGMQIGKIIERRPSLCSMIDKNLNSHFNEPLLTNPPSEMVNQSNGDEENSAWQ